MAYLAKIVTESLVYMARKHVHIIEKTFNVFTKLFFATFYDIGVYPIAENFRFSSCSRLSGKLQKTQENLLHSLVQKNMRVFFTLPHEI